MLKENKDLHAKFLYHRNFEVIFTTFKKVVKESYPMVFCIDCNFCIERTNTKHHRLKIEHSFIIQKSESEHFS